MLHVINASCVACDLHTIATRPLARTCWRRFTAQRGDCKQSWIAPLNAIIIIILLLLVSLLESRQSIQIDWICHTPSQACTSWPSAWVVVDLSDQAWNCGARTLPKKIYTKKSYCLVFPPEETCLVFSAKEWIQRQRERERDFVASLVDFVNVSTLICDDCGREVSVLFVWVFVYVATVDPFNVLGDAVECYTHVRTFPLWSRNLHECIWKVLNYWFHLWMFYDWLVSVKSSDQYLKNMKK